MRTDILNGASVKVMRSYDYCHFEVVLSTTIVITLQDVDEMRKEAARLADKAVAQYKIAKQNAETRAIEQGERPYRVRQAEAIRAMAETDRSIEEKAYLKAFDDEQWQATREYDYEDDWP